MALLSVAKRKEYFELLGLGKYNKSGIKRFQKIAFPTHPNEWDSSYGTKTDTALRHWRNVKVFAPSFKPEEFKCPCGRCTGYPTRMKTKQLKHIQAIRDHYKKPMIVTSGLRCSYYNSKCGGSVQNSSHLHGYATDFYMKGVTDTLAHRKKAVKYIRKLKNHNYTYGNGLLAYTNGSIRSWNAPNMGNALHTCTK